jgi:hypothetical protein
MSNIRRSKRRRKYTISRIPAKTTDKQFAMERGRQDRKGRKGRKKVFVVEEMPDR